MGGGVMRAAAKVAGAGTLRGLVADHHPLSSAARRAASVRPAASAVEDVKLVASNSEVSATKSPSEVDDWVFAGEEVVSVGAPMPRVVFGGVPTLHEAAEATYELSAALEKAYLSSPYEESVCTLEKEVAGLSLLSRQDLESPATALPAPAVMAFRFLSESPGAKNVVASIASDPNVWNAVLRNEEFQGYLLSQRACISAPGMDLQADSVSDDAFLNQSAAIDDHPSMSQESNASDGEGFFQKIKNAVFGIMNRFSDYFKDFFGGKVGDKVSVDADGSWANYEDALKVFGLAVVVILVIVLKRG